jgi:hypothetical protein
MKTIEFYLLLILFFNVLEQEKSSPTIDSFNSDSTISDLDSKNSDINMPNTDSSTTNSDNTLVNSDSSATNSDNPLVNSDSSTSNSDNPLVNSDSSTANSDNTLVNSDSSTANSDNPLSNTDSSKANSDNPLVNSDSSTSNSDFILSTIDPSNGNTTQTTTPIISVRPKIVLLGFGLFRRPIRSLVTFKVYFKRFLVRIASRLLYMTVNTNYLRRLRVLEEQKANCTLITPDEEDDMAYNCNVSVDPNKNFTMSANGDFDFVGLNPDLIISSYANSTMKSLSSQTDDIFAEGILTLENSILSQDDKTFKIEGYLMEDELKDKQVLLSLDENGNGNLVNVTCNVNDKGSKKYELVCTSNKKVKAHLEGVMGKTSDKPLLIHMADPNEDLVDIQSPAINYKAKKSSSGGLSGGAIAAIIIVCCVALIASLVTAFLIKRQSKPPIQEFSAVDLNSSNQIKNTIN